MSKVTLTQDGLNGIACRTMLLTGHAASLVAPPVSPTVPASPAVLVAPVAPAVPDVRSVRTAHFPPSAPGRWDTHVHDVHELLWGAQGLLTVETADGFFAVPSTMGLWIPAGVVHAVQSASGTGFYCTHVDATLPATLSARTTAVAVVPAVRELLIHMSTLDMRSPVRSQAEHLVVNLIDPVDVGPMVLPMPADPRLARVARSLLEDPADPRSLDDWGHEVSISVRNLSRLFHRETGMTFAQWRIHARIRVAVGLLAGGLPVGVVSRRVGYSTPSAFVQSFRRVLGHTPGWYVSSTRAGREHSLAGPGDRRSGGGPRAKLG